ncbi:MAG: sensor histidine kinase, partial [Actinomycetales bacterium]
MLRTLGIRAKLLAILAAPLIVLVVLSGIVVNGAMRTASRAEQVSSLTGMSSSVMSFIGQLQRERSLTDAVQHASDEARGALKAQLVKQRVATGLSLNDTRDQLEQASTKGFGAAFAKAVLAAQNGHGAIQSARRSADTGDQPFEFVMASYDTAVDRDLALVRAVSDLTDDPGVAASLRSYVSLAEGVDEAWHERDVASDAFAAGSISPSDYSRYAGAVRQEETTFQAFQSTATAAARAAFAKAVPQDLQYQLVAGRQHVEELLFGATAGAQGFDWDKVADARIAALTGLLPRLGADVGVQADDVAASARQRALTLAAVTGAGVLLLLGLAYLMARRLVRRLTRLTQLATLTAERLPSLVEQVQTPGEKPHLDLGRVPVDSRDEVGRLAEAFNAVNEVTMRVAEEQAALRGSIADIFVNVARRNQVLLSRQLALIDAMESRETNADTLENLFRVDHLSTRMRRNAESLLVLAGIDASRRLREPLALTDVVRSAVSEIESYDRVDLAAGFDAPVLGRAAMTAAHLLAELLENATTFSSPGSRVVVATSPAKSGVEVTITDEGLGMSDEDLARANDVMANPPVLELALAQRLGFYVVGRLAARLGARVTLRKGRRSGTVAKVWLPADLFTTGSLPHVADPLLDRLAEGPVAEEAVLALPDTPVVPNDAA